MAEGSSTEPSDITAVHISESNSSPVESEFVASFFVSNSAPSYLLPYFEIPAFLCHRGQTK